MNDGRSVLAKVTSLYRHTSPSVSLPQRSVNLMALAATKLQTMLTFVAFLPWPFTRLRHFCVIKFRSPTQFSFVQFSSKKQTTRKCCAMRQNPLTFWDYWIKPEERDSAHATCLFPSPCAEFSGSFCFTFYIFYFTLKKCFAVRKVDRDHIRSIRDRGKRVRGNRMSINSSSQHSDQQRPKRPSATARTLDVKELGTSPVQCEAACELRNLLFQQLCGTKPQRQSPENRLLEPEAEDSSADCESLAPPSSCCSCSVSLCVSPPPPSLSTILVK